MLSVDNRLTDGACEFTAAPVICRHVRRYRVSADQGSRIVVFEFTSSLVRWPRPRPFCLPTRRKVEMGQTKSKVECPLCGGRSDSDDGGDTPSVNGAASPEKEQAQFDASKPLLSPQAAVDDDGAGGRGHPSTASLPAYVGTGPLSSVAEEPGLTCDVGGDTALAENHTTSTRHQLVVLRGNRHHPPGLRVRSVHRSVTLDRSTSMRTDRPFHMGTFHAQFSSISCAIPVPFMGSRHFKFSIRLSSISPLYNLKCLDPMKGGRCMRSRIEKLKMN